MNDATSRSATKRTEPGRSPIQRCRLHPSIRLKPMVCRCFIRAAGEANAPVVLLLHGFPTSSFMFRELIPRLATDYRVIAPDLPGFGFHQGPG